MDLRLIVNGFSGNEGPVSGVRQRDPGDGRLELKYQSPPSSPTPGTTTAESRSFESWSSTRASGQKATVVPAIPPIQMPSPGGVFGDANSSASESDISVYSVSSSHEYTELLESGASSPMAHASGSVASRPVAKVGTFNGLGGRLPSIATMGIQTAYHNNVARSHNLTSPVYCANYTHHPHGVNGALIEMQGAECAAHIAGGAATPGSSVKRLRITSHQPGLHSRPHSPPPCVFVMSGSRENTLDSHVVTSKRSDAPGSLKQYSCKTCHRSFVRKSGLIRHEKIHLGIRPNICGMCGKRFSQRSALTVHYRVHTGEKPYSCNVCGRPFSDSSSLARHRRIHMRASSLSSAPGGEATVTVLSKSPQSLAI